MQVQRGIKDRSTSQVGAGKCWVVQAMTVQVRKHWVER